MTYRKEAEAAAVCGLILGAGALHASARAFLPIGGRPADLVRSRAKNPAAGARTIVPRPMMNGQRGSFYVA
jgi:hypothetical protein